MIITKTPFRISLFGGGSDFPQWYESNLGRVISFTIDKYCYISARYLPPFFKHKFRIVYSKTEEVSDISLIKHPAVREALKLYKITNGLELHHFGDLPARSGVGSSSAFAVGLLYALSKLNSREMVKKDLAQKAIDLEQNKLKENVGSQDQIACTYGGFNEIIFEKDKWTLNPIVLNLDYQNEIEDRMILVFSGVTRNSTDISKGLISNYSQKELLIKSMVSLSGIAFDLLQKHGNLDELGILLNEAWTIKKELNPMTTNKNLDDLYSYAMNNGALGGKVLGAGGGGFMLFWLKKGQKARFYNALKHSIVVPFSLEFNGCETILDSTKERVK